jgi:hypothetical protein
MHLRPTSKSEKALWGRPSGLPQSFRPARNFTQTRGLFFEDAAALYLSAGSAGDLVAGPRTNRVFDRVRFE